MPYLDDFPDGVVIADATGTVEHINAAASRFLATSSDALVGTHVRAALPLDDRQGNHWFDCLQPYDGFASRTRLSEQSWYSSSGVELLMTALLVRDEPRGPVRRLVISLRDARARARRERDRSDLVATVAHELRSPLTGVKGFTSTLLSKWDRFSDEQRQLMLETIDSDADRLTRLITELLDAARIDSGRLTLRPEPVAVGDLAQRVLDSIAAGSGQSFVADTAPDVPTIWADRDRLTQVLTNLLENATRHGKGIEAVTVRPDDLGEGVVLDVDDRGPGIAPEFRTRVFTRFWQSGERGGSGLGLFIVKGIVDAHRGDVVVLDGPDGGARVRLRLPVNQPAALRD